VQWLWIDKPGAFGSFSLDGLKVFGAPDLAVRFAGKVHLFDWKTGRPVASDAEQIDCYALFAAAQWGCRVDDMAGYVVHLDPEYSQERRPFSDEWLEAARDAIRRSYREMLALVGEENKANERDFPKTQNERVCGRCSFAELCKER
jgi:CRISPR/Cas system-associated exonuclease Cas4 (RecB family)